MSTKAELYIIYVAHYATMLPSNHLAMGYNETFFINYAGIMAHKSFHDSTI